MRGPAGGTVATGMGWCSADCAAALAARNSSARPPAAGHGPAQRGSACPQGATGPAAPPLADCAVSVPYCVHLLHRKEVVAAQIEQVRHKQRVHGQPTAHRPAELKRLRRPPSGGEEAHARAQGAGPGTAAQRLLWWRHAGRQSRAAAAEERQMAMRCCRHPPAGRRSVAYPCASMTAGAESTGVPAGSPRHLRA